MAEIGAGVPTFVGVVNTAVILFSSYRLSIGSEKTNMAADVMFTASE